MNVLIIKLCFLNVLAFNRNSEQANGIATARTLAARSFEPDLNWKIVSEWYVSHRIYSHLVWFHKHRSLPCCCKPVVHLAGNFPCPTESGSSQTRRTCWYFPLEKNQEDHSWCIRLIGRQRWRVCRYWMSRQDLVQRVGPAWNRAGRSVLFQSVSPNNHSHR